MHRDRTGGRRYEDRHDAGQQLATAVRERNVQADVVLAIPRGGLPLGREVADALDLPLDVVVASKIGAPNNPEYAIGAAGSDGSAWLDRETIDELDISRAYVERERKRETEAAREKAERYREGPPTDVAGKRVLVVDDGVATGATTKAAVELLRSKGPRGIVLAVPVGPPHSIAELRDLADEVICLQTASSFSAVGQFYQSFEQVTDEEAMAYLHGETAT